MVQAYRAEISALAAAGCTFIQMDDTCFAKLCDPVVRERLAGRGYPFESLVEQYASAIERIIADPPAGVVFGFHACRGSFMGLSGASGGYEPVGSQPAEFQRFIDSELRRMADVGRMTRITLD